MSEKKESDFKNDATEAAQPDERVVMQFIMKKDGQMIVESPVLGDKLACYGIIEHAKDIVRAMHTPKPRLFTRGH